jgi:diguanylate cyclase (GGDEF)-like protein
VRAGDSVARIGGEEFVALLPDTDADGAANVAETVRAAVEASTPLVAGAPLAA